MRHEHHWRRILITVTGAGALGGLGWMTLGGGAESASAEAAGAAAPSGQYGRRGLASAEADACAFGPGAGMAYEVTTRTHAALDLGPLSDEVRVGGRFATQTTGPQDRRATRRWHLDLRAVARAADGSSILAARVLDQGTEIEGEGTSAADEGLAEPFLVRVDRRCGIEAFGWRTAGDRHDARTQQALVAALSFWAPGDADERAGTVYGGMAFDALGRYRSTYQATGAGRIEGRIEGYAEPFPQPRSPVPPTLVVESSRLEVQPGDGAWFQRLEGERAVGLRVRDEEIGTMHHQVHAERVEASGWDPAVRVSDEGWTWGLLLEEGAEASVETPVDPTLAALSAGEAVDRYLAMVHGGQTTAQYAGFLSQWLRANPEGAAALVERLRAGAFDEEDRARSALFYALGTADTPEATAMLVELVAGEDSATAHRVSAAHALAKLPHPTEEVVEALAMQADRRDLHPVARGSLAMALGTFAHENEGRSAGLAQAARDQIEGWLAEPGDEDDLSSSLLAAGNAGHDDLAEAIGPYLEHEAPRIRQQAAHALRQMSPQEAFPRLEAGMHDDDRSVRVKVLASATEVSRHHGVLPPAEMIDTAASWLSASADRSEERALITLLGEAAQRGSKPARGALHDRLTEELRSEHRDPARLRALGAFANNRWQADAAD